MYGPKKPVSIFDGDNLAQFAAGLLNASMLRQGLGGDPGRADVGTCMVVLSDTENEQQRKQDAGDERLMLDILYGNEGER